MSKLREMKAAAYDRMAMIEVCQKELTQLNAAIQAETQKQRAKASRKLAKQ